MENKIKVAIIFFAHILKRINVMFADALEVNNKKKLLAMKMISDFSEKEINEFVQHRLGISYNEKEKLLPIRSSHQVYSKRSNKTISFEEIFGQDIYRTKSKFFKKDMASVPVDLFSWPENDGQIYYLTTFLVNDFFTVEELVLGIQEFIKKGNPGAKNLCHLLPVIFDEYIFERKEFMNGFVPVFSALSDSQKIQQRILRYGVKTGSQIHFQDIESHVGTYVIDLFSRVYVLTDHPICSVIKIYRPSSAMD